MTAPIHAAHTSSAQAGRNGTWRRGTPAGTQRLATAAYGTPGVHGRQAHALEQFIVIVRVDDGAAREARERPPLPAPGPHMTSQSPLRLSWLAI